MNSISCNIRWLFSFTDDDGIYEVVSRAPLRISSHDYNSKYWKVSQELHMIIIWSHDYHSKIWKVSQDLSIFPVSFMRHFCAFSTGNFLVCLHDVCSILGITVIQKQYQRSTFRSVEMIFILMQHFIRHHRMYLLGRPVWSCHCRRWQVHSCRYGYLTDNAIIGRHVLLTENFLNKCSNWCFAELLVYLMLMN